MIFSEKTDKIVPALLSIQGELGPVVKGAENPYFKSKFADLNEIRRKTVPVLAAHKCFLIQPLTIQDGIEVVNTVVVHESGQWVKSSLPLKANNDDPQKQGIGITYARRYTLKSLFMMEEVDDDAEGAMDRPKKDSLPKEVELPMPENAGNRDEMIAEIGELVAVLEKEQADKAESIRAFLYKKDGDVKKAVSDAQLATTIVKIKGFLGE